MTAAAETEVEHAPRRPRRRASGGGLGRYILLRFLLIIPTVFILMTVVFFLMRITGDPITAALGGRYPLLGRLAGVLGLAGSVCTRFGIFEAGIISTEDPKYTVVPQRERLEPADEQEDEGGDEVALADRLVVDVGERAAPAARRLPGLLQALDRGAVDGDESGHVSPRLARR